MSRASLIPDTGTRLSPIADSPLDGIEMPTIASWLDIGMGPPWARNADLFLELSLLQGTCTPTTRESPILLFDHLNELPVEENNEMLNAPARESDVMPTAQRGHMPLPGPGSYQGMPIT